MDSMKQEGRYSASPQKKGKSRRKPIHNRDKLQEALEELPAEKRGAIRNVADGLGISKTHAGRLLKNDDDFVAHTNSIKPSLEDADEAKRLLHATGRIICSDSGTFVFKGACDKIHVDKKWFHLTQINQRVYMTKKEKQAKNLQRHAKHKSHTTKVMFVCATARPRFDETTGECLFDGKIGLWPVVAKVPAARTSKNWPAGTIETKCVPLTKTCIGTSLLKK